MRPDDNPAAPKSEKQTTPPERKTAPGVKKSPVKKKLKKSPAAEKVATSPKFPYSTKPNSLRKFLEKVPQKPKPARVNRELLRAWGMNDSNDQTIIRVLKELGLVGQNNEPTEKYVEYMTPGRGPAVLASAIKEVWAPLFSLSHQPQREDDATLRNYFNIHSGGSDTTIAQQIQSFKAVCDFADFSKPGSPEEAKVRSARAGVSSLDSGDAAPVLHIDLHIHLPENKARRDYEYIFEDIAKHLLGRKSSALSEE